jgi:hypothetical protein
MKNIHLLPTDKPNFGRYLVFNKENTLCIWDTELIGGQKTLTPHHIYITSDEEIKGGYAYYPELNEVLLFDNKYGEVYEKGRQLKIILTTDPDLIADGVQAIDDEFLKWFVKNPNCEFVRIAERFINKDYDSEYVIIIPQEEPKKLVGERIMPLDNDNIEEEEETLEEIAENELRKQDWDTTITLPFNGGYIEGFQQGAKWQQEQERMYSEEEVLELVLSRPGPYLTDDEIKEWFEQFKKK